MNKSIPLSIQNLSIGYKRAIASNINLELSSSEFVTIMGENGVGKTSFIDALIGFTEPLSGDIFFWGEKNKDKNREFLNRRVGWVISQKEQFPIGLTIDKFLKLISVQYSTWNWMLCEELLKNFDLDRAKKLSQLSTGEHSKVRLIKALSFEPSLLILDELTANLSPDSKAAILRTLLDLFSSRPLSVVYISHSQDEANKLSDRIFNLNEKGLSLIGGQNV